MTRTTMFPLAVYFVAITGGYLWGMSIGPSLNLDAQTSSLIGMALGGLIAFSYMKKR